MKNFNTMKGVFPILLFVISLSLIGSQANAQRKAKSVRPFNHAELPAPSGMVYIPGGSILMRYGNGADSVTIRKYSLSPFFIDKAEVTNKQYREFVNWVIDSVAVTKYLRNDGTLFSYRTRDSGLKYINWDKVKHKELFGAEAAANKALQGMYKDGEINREYYTFAYKYNKLGPNGKRERVTEMVNVYPNTEVWASDFPNSQTDMMVQQYFNSTAFDDYPVVGVTWKQAMAYAYWRTNSEKRKGASFMKDFALPYSLPSEAQWVHAAVGEQVADDSVVSDVRVFNSKEKLDVNFKQEEGNYTEDGASYTVPVLAYAPNKFGLYNMFGNAAEWLLDAYNASAYAFVHDQNPVILYDADSTDSDIMKSKLVRGGSWKDNANSLSPFNRSYEVQDVPHSYIGFRLVVPAPEIISKQISTRRKRQ